MVWCGEKTRMELRARAVREAVREKLCRSLPAAIRVYHTHLDSEDGVDGLFDARKVPLAEGPQHLILSNVHQGLLRGRNDDSVAVLHRRSVRARHSTLDTSTR